MGQTVTHAFSVQGMHCASCGMLIDETLEDLAGVRVSATDLRKNQSVVELDPARCSPQQVIAAIGEAGYTARLQA